MQCPKCGGNVDVYDVYDTDQSGDYLLEKVCGSCDECGTGYSWRRRSLITFEEDYDVRED